MTAWVIVIGFGLAIAGVVVKVGLDAWRDLQEDRAAHGGRISTRAARRALWTAVVVFGLVLALVVWPLVLGTSGN